MRGAIRPSDFKLRFDVGKVRTFASRYDHPGESELIVGPVKRARERGYLTHDEFLAIGRWKSERPRKRQAANSPAFVEETTGLALATETSPKLAIEVLTLLDGVGWSTASVILHLCHRQRYPILDFRALWSVGVEVRPQYTFECWSRYTEFTREVADRALVDMRTLDRALWKYSELYQRAA